MGGEMNKQIRSLISEIKNKDEIIYQLALYASEAAEQCPDGESQKKCRELLKSFDDVHIGCIVCQILYAQRKADDRRKAFDQA